MGEYGPCRPCSEIFFDHGEEHKTKNLDIKNGDILEDENRYVEIWNLVFMQFEKTPNGIINPFQTHQLILALARKISCSHAK